MAKTSTVFFCTSCGYESSKWMGQCPGCKEWNTFVEGPVSRSPRGGGSAGAGERLRRAVPTVLSQVRGREEDRLITGIGELDRVLGGGIVQG